MALLTIAMIALCAVALALYLGYIFYRARNTKGRGLLRGSTSTLFDAYPFLESESVKNIWFGRIFYSSNLEQELPKFNYYDGILLLKDDALHFFKEGKETAEWNASCAELSARYRELMSFEKGNVFLNGPTFSFALKVSKEHLNQFASNDFKLVREHRYGRQFVKTLYAHGAKPC